MSLDEKIFEGVKNAIEIVVAIFKQFIFDSISYGFSQNPIVYLLAFYIGFLISWYVFGFFFEKLKRPFSWFTFIGTLAISIYVGVLFAFSGFIAGIFLSLVVMDIVKFIFPRLGYDYSKLYTRKIALYFWILPLIIKIFLEKKKQKKLQEEQNKALQERFQQKIEKLIEEDKEAKKEKEEKEKQIREVESILDDKIENLLKKLERF